MSRRPFARRAVAGACQDCGYRVPTRLVRFWTTGMLYRVCRGCERSYWPRGRGYIARPVAPEVTR